MVQINIDLADQQDIQGSQGALTLALYRTLNIKHKIEALNNTLNSRKIDTMDSNSELKIDISGKRVPNIYDSFPEESSPYV